MADTTKLKGFACRDAGVDCDWRTEGKNEDEILEKVRQHAKTDHPDVPVTEELVQKVRSLIKPVTQKAA